jgi:SMC interacting uncharacterized protein involved in chromosome segregation
MKSTLVKEKVTLSAIGALIERSIAVLPTKDEMNKSIDDLAGAVKKGFDEVHEKFTKIDEKFIKVDKRFDAVDERFNVLERKVDRMKDDFTNQLDYLNIWSPTRIEFTVLDDRVKKVEKKLKV